MKFGTKQRGETIKLGNDLVFGTNHRLGELVGTIGLKLRSGVRIFHKYTYFSLLAVGRRNSKGGPVRPK